MTPAPAASAARSWLGRRRRTATRSARWLSAPGATGHRLPRRQCESLAVGGAERTVKQVVTSADGVLMEGECGLRRWRSRRTAGSWSLPVWIGPNPGHSVLCFLAIEIIWSSRSRGWLPAPIYDKRQFQTSVREFETV
jgi:hypothetical protein